MSAAIRTIRRGQVECLCECGGTPKGGKYLPGHDQKLRRDIEAKVGGLVNLKAIVEALEHHANGGLTEQSICQILGKLEELESIRAFDEAKASGGETVPFEQAVEENDWLRAAAQNPAFDFLKEPSEDIYTLADGRPFHDAR